MSRPDTPTLSGHQTSRRHGFHVPRCLSFSNIGAVYVWLVIIGIFSAWIPQIFDNATTAKQILNGNAVTGLVALSIVIPLTTRTFDLSVAYVASLAGVTAPYFVVQGVPLAGAILITLAICAAVGLTNAIIVVVLRIDSFIATLASGSLISAFITMFTNNEPITSASLAGPFAEIGQGGVAGITLPVFYMLGVAALIWFLLEQTAMGRRMYAAGFNAEAARLAGVRVARLRFVALIISAFIAGIAGIALSSIIDSGSPTAGVSYLLPAFAAAFLGATQLRHGRFNAWGTLIAVMLLGTGITGLTLANAPDWSEDMFTGVVLIAALAITGVQRRGGVRRVDRVVATTADDPVSAASTTAPAVVPGAGGPAARHEGGEVGHE